MCVCQSGCNCDWQAGLRVTLPGTQKAGLECGWVTAFSAATSCNTQQPSAAYCAGQSRCLAIIFSLATLWQSWRNTAFTITDPPCQRINTIKVIHAARAVPLHRRKTVFIIELREDALEVRSKRQLYWLHRFRSLCPAGSSNWGIKQSQMQK